MDNSATTKTADAVQPAAESPGPAWFRRFILPILRWCGIDRAIAYTLAGRGWSVIATPVTWLLISHYLLPAEQGFYYTFGSVIAMNVLLELGLTGVLVQFASHETANLSWTTSRTLSGSDPALSRLGAIFRISLKWYGAAAGLVILLLMPTGVAFFSHNSGSTRVAWHAPWVFLTIVAAANLLCMPLLATLEGCGKVAAIASLRVAQNVMASLGLWVTLMLHGALFAGPVFEGLDTSVALTWLAIYYRPFFKSLVRKAPGEAIFNWRKEVWPFQWRIAVTSMGGYLISQLFNPALFATRGPIVAGQMGMSLSVAGGLVVISYAWIGTKAPMFGGLVAKRKWGELDALFFRTLRHSLLALAVLSVVAFAAVSILPSFARTFSKRLLDPLPFAFLLVASMMNHVIFCEALYLRAHKAEPFLVVSVAIGILMAAATFAVAGRFGATGVCVGYSACTLVALVLSTWIFLNKRRDWHA